MMLRPLHFGHMNTCVAASSLACAVVFLAAIASPSIAASSSERSEVATRLGALEARTHGLARSLAVDLPQPAREIQLAQNQPIGDTYAATVEVRLSDLETQLRTLTGRVEQLQYENRQLSDRLQRALADMEFRLTELEGGDPFATADGGGEPAAQAEPPAGGASGSGGGSGIGPMYDQLTGNQGSGQGSSDGSQTLGTLTLPRETLAVPGGSPAPSGSAAATTAPNDPAAALYDSAFSMLQQTNYDGAEQAMKTFVRDYPSHPLASNAQYWLGETYYARGRFNDAAIAFAQGYQQYPSGAKAIDSLLKLGLSLAAMDQTADACLTFAQLNQQFPNAPAAIRGRATQERDRLQCR